MFAALLAGLVASQWKAWCAVAIACVAFVAMCLFVWRAWLNKPRLRIGDPLINDETWHSSSALAVPAREAYLHVWNEPRHGGHPVERVYVTLRCIRESDGAELWRDVCARWSFSSKDIREEETLTARFLSLYPSDPRARIDIALKINGTDECYVINDRTMFEGPYRNFGRQSVIVEVVAHGAAFGLTIRGKRTYRLRQTGTHGDLDLSPMEGQLRLGRRILSFARGPDGTDQFSLLPPERS